MNEPLAICRILFRGGSATLWPWIILAISFGVNLAVYAVGDLPPEAHQSGGILSLFLTAIFATQQMWTRILPFTIDQSGTRRGFLAGMGIFVLAGGLVAGLLLAALGSLEATSAGWGVDMRFFRTSVLDGLSFGQRAVLLGVLFLLVSAIGCVAGAVMVRWGTAGMWGLLVGSIVLGGGLSVLLTWHNTWSTLSRWFVEHGWFEVWVAYPLLLTTAFVAASWVIVRRAEVT